ncbi:MAG: hypothetical protein ACI9LM_002148 [Alteromonadaceae bacterium]|jgi:hypothetical protein
MMIINNKIADFIFIKNRQQTKSNGRFDYKKDDNNIDSNKCKYQVIH